MSGATVTIPNFGTDAHYFESALQSLQGIVAAEMAKEGMNSNPDIAGYLSSLLGKEKVIPEKIVEDLGSTWVLRNIWIKKYPCCFLTHRHIDVLLELRNQHDLSDEQVKEIEIHISPSDEICNRPEVKTVGDLQFSYQHILSSAMLDGDLNFTHIDSDIIGNPAYKEARAKVTVNFHPDWSNIYMEEPAQVIIRTKDGKEYSSERMHPIGSPKEPLSMKQFGALFSKFTRGILADEHIEKTAEALRNLETLNDVEELMDILTFRHKMGGA
jgi:2-methylcitrate dehydratase PrpD